MMLFGSYLPSPARIKRSAVGGVLIALFSVTAYVALVVSLWFVLDDVYGPKLASLSIAAGSILAALLVWAVVSFMNHRARRRALIASQLRAASLEQSMAQAAMLSVPGLVQKSPIATLVAVAGISYALMKAAKGPPR